MQPRILRTTESERDYREIWHYIAVDNPVAADRLLRTFEEKLQLYARHPGMGTSRHKLSPELRSFPVGNYVVFYEPLPDGLKLIRVLHGARVHKRLFRQ